jgi:hypothetical protein
MIVDHRNSCVAVIRNRLACAEMFVDRTFQVTDPTAVHSLE